MGVFFLESEEHTLLRLPRDPLRKARPHPDQLSRGARLRRTNRVIRFEERIAIGGLIV